MPSPDSLNDRVIELESVVTHLQRDLDKLNEVVLEQQAEIAALKTLVDRLETRADLWPPEGESRDPEQERPPHY